MKKVSFSLFVAAVLWFVMFSPWTSASVNFWQVMSVSAATLIALALFFGNDWKQQFRFNGRAFGIGIGSAAILWIVFYFGDLISSYLFDFARPQIDNVYGMKSGENLSLLSILLFLLIAPAEEIFWRGYIQRSLSARFGKNTGLILATTAYTLVHIWSFNFMLIMSALVVGFAWGWLYKKEANLVTLILSHAIWDVTIFILLPTSNV